MVVEMMSLAAINANSSPKSVDFASNLLITCRFLSIFLVASRKKRNFGGIKCLNAKVWKRIDIGVSIVLRRARNLHFLLFNMVQGKKQLNSKTKFAMLLSAVDTN